MKYKSHQDRRREYLTSVGHSMVKFTGDTSFYRFDIVETILESADKGYPIRGAIALFNENLNPRSVLFARMFCLTTSTWKLHNLLMGGKPYVKYGELYIDPNLEAYRENQK